jgi:hypothetical protein
MAGDVANIHVTEIRHETLEARIQPAEGFFFEIDAVGIH